MDFGANVKDYKIIAREMMLMIAKKNKKYFKEFQEKKVVATVQCVTCYRSKPEPNQIYFL